MATAQTINFNSSRIQLNPPESWHFFHADDDGPLPPFLSSGDSRFDAVYSSTPAMTLSFCGERAEVLGVDQPQAAPIDLQIDGVSRRRAGQEPVQHRLRATPRQPLAQVEGLLELSRHNITLHHNGTPSQQLAIQQILLNARQPDIPQQPHLATSPAFSVTKTVSRSTVESVSRIVPSSTCNFTPLSCGTASSRAESTSPRPSSPTSTTSSSLPSGSLNTTDSSDDEGQGDSLNSSIIAGLAVGGATIVLILGLLLYFLLRRSRRKASGNRASSSTTSTDAAFVAEPEPTARPPMRQAITESSWVHFAAHPGTSESSLSDSSHRSHSETISSEHQSGAGALSSPSVSQENQSSPGHEDALNTFNVLSTSDSTEGHSTNTSHLRRSGTVDDPFRRNPRRQLSVRNPDDVDITDAAPNPSSRDVFHALGHRASQATSASSEPASLVDPLTGSGAQGWHDLPTSDSKTSFAGTPREVQDVTFGGVTEGRNEGSYF